MKLIAEIDTKDGGSLRLSYDGEMLTVGEAVVALDEFKRALDAVAPQPKVSSLGAAQPPTRNADGSRRGGSPRFTMKAVKPEANVEVAYEHVEDDGETAA